jgi:dihydrofolate synthase / folylpolyglutamate synthase
MEYLGDTIGEIAWNKAGIIKRDSIVVTTTQEQAAFNAIEEKCKELNNQLIISKTSNVDNIVYDNLQIFFDYNELKNIELNLAGSYQIENAVIAIETVRALNLKGFRISEESIKSGLRNTKWLGRFSKIWNDPLVIIDGAHNKAAAIRLKETIEHYFKDKKLMFVMGVLKDKEYDKIAEILTPIAFKIITVTTPNHPRALSGEELAVSISKYNSNVEYVASIKEAVQICLFNDEGVDGIIAFGSLSYLGEFEACVKGIKHESEIQK